MRGNKPFTGVAMRPHILFVDDNPDICELVPLILQAAGFHVSTTDNSADVLRLVTSEHFDALLLDYWMPETTGIELCRQIRKFDQSTPILICSGAVTEADREAATLAGAQGYVLKPFVSGNLILALRSVMSITHACSERPHDTKEPGRPLTTRLLE
jgi:DNA-binding response OmpR family regulator